MGNRITHTITCNHRIAATLYTLENFFEVYLHKCDKQQQQQCPLNLIFSGKIKIVHVIPIVSNFYCIDSQCHYSSPS